MSNDAERSWWPLNLSPAEDEAVRDMIDGLCDHPGQHDRSAAQGAADLLSTAMARYVGDIVDRDTLPHYCHLLNGWGNARFAGGHLLDGYARYVHRTATGVPHILQCADEGDFHPWQSIAYAIMAGVHPAAPIKGVGCSLVELAAGSRLLDTDDGCELGHLLYSVAHLGFEPSTQFGLHTEVVDLNRLVEMAVDAHRDGHFKVCRKFHLTEGLCAVARKIPGLERHRASAEGFLAGQLDLLPVFAAALFGARQARERGQPVADGSVVACLRESLAIGGFIENHFYLAGHLIELATLATSFGYTVTDGQWAAIRFVVDELDALLPEYLPHVSLPGCFLHFGHYRRAITLLAELVNGASLDRYSRARFTSDFERPSAGTAGDHDPTATAKPSGVYAVARSDRQMRSELSAVVQAYRSIAARGLEPRGDAAHFRRVLVDGWPRWLHFELLDYGSGVIADARRTSGIGVELHLERQDHEFFEVLGRVAASLAGSTRLRNVESDPGWWGGAGRLRAWFEDSTPPETTARALDELIRTTVPILAPEISYRFPRTTAP